MRSDKMTKGPSAAPRLALMKALGLTDEEIDRPLIGIVSSKNDIVPGHMNLDKVVDAVKQGSIWSWLSGDLPGEPLPGQCRRCAARLPGHRGVRRPRDGARGHEVLARFP